jgi:hypothetical protein
MCLRDAFAWCIMWETCSRGRDCGRLRVSDFVLADGRTLFTARAALRQAPLPTLYLAPQGTKTYRGARAPLRKLAPRGDVLCPVKILGDPGKAGSRIHRRRFPRPSSTATAQPPPPPPRDPAYIYIHRTHRTHRIYHRGVKSWRKFSRVLVRGRRGVKSWRKFSLVLVLVLVTSHGSIPGGVDVLAGPVRAAHDVASRLVAAEKETCHSFRRGRLQHEQRAGVAPAALLPLGEMRAPSTQKRYLDEGWHVDPRGQARRKAK